MRSKTLFFILVILVFGLLFFCGFQFIETNLKLFFIIEGVTVLTIILFILLYLRLIKPFQILTDSMELLKEQDFSSRLRSIPHSEANKLIMIFNRMMDQLRNERLSVREKNHFLDLLIQASTQGVISFDFDSHISGINPAGLRLLDINKAEDVIGKRLSDIDNRICKHLTQLEPDKESLIRIGGITQYRCTLLSFIDRGASHPFILIEELTHELLAIEKKSYEGVIRMMAHEVNNSVGAISSILNVISDIAGSDQNKELAEVLPAVDASFNRCKHLGRFVSNLAEVVKIPEPSRSNININNLLQSVRGLTSGKCKERNIEVELQLAEVDCHAFVDSIQFEQVFVNIIKNAYEAIGNNGTIRIVSRIKPLRVSIENNGIPLTDEVKEKLFTPFFTTKDKGQGIGLIFVREVLTNHNCKFDFYSKNEWTVFEIAFE